MVSFVFFCRTYEENADADDNQPPVGLLHEGTVQKSGDPKVFHQCSAEYSGGSHPECKANEYLPLEAVLVSAAEDFGCTCGTE